MSGVLSTVAIVVALLLAGWALLASALNRPPDRAQQIGAYLVSAMVAVLIIVAATDWQPAETATFVGYALTALLLPIAGWALAKMEPTRYGSLIVGVAAIIVPVLVLRMGQVWAGS